MHAMKIPTNKGANSYKLKSSKSGNGKYSYIRGVPIDIRYVIVLRVDCGTRT